MKKVPKKKDNAPKQTQINQIMGELLDVFNKYKLPADVGYEIITQIQCNAERAMVQSESFDPDSVERLRQSIRRFCKMQEPKDTDEDEEDDDMDAETVGGPVPPGTHENIPEPEPGMYG